MLPVLVERRHLIDPVEFPVGTHSGKPPGLELRQAVLLRSLLHFHDGRENHELRFLRKTQDILENLIRGPGFNGPAALGAGNRSQTREEHAQKIVDFCHGAHCGAGIVGRGPLFQGYGRRQTLDFFHVGLVHLGQKLPRVGGKGLNVAALSFCVNDIERQSGFTRSGRTADNHELIAGNIQADVAQIVLAGMFDVDALLCGLHLTSSPA